MIFEKVTIGDATLIRGDSIALLEQGFYQQFVGVEFSQEHFDTAVKRVKAFYGLLEGSNMDMLLDPA